MESIIQKDQNGNIVYRRYARGLEEWMEYDEHGREIHYRNSNGYELWKQYNERGNEIHFRNSNGYEVWHEYDERGNMSHYRTSTGIEEWYTFDKHRIPTIHTTNHHPPPIVSANINITEENMKTRFELEQQIMECWHITCDIETVIESIDGMEIKATDKDKLLNMLIGLRTLYDCRFTKTLDTFGELVKHKVILNPTQYV